MTAYTPFDGQRVEQVEFEGRDSRRFDDHVERADLIDRMVRRHLTSVDIVAADAGQPARSCRVSVDDVETRHVGVTQAQGQSTSWTVFVPWTTVMAFTRRRSVGPSRLSCRRRVVRADTIA